MLHNTLKNSIVCMVSLMIIPTSMIFSMKRQNPYVQPIIIQTPYATPYVPQQMMQFYIYDPYAQWDYDAQQNYLQTTDTIDNSPDTIDVFNNPTHEEPSIAEPINSDIIDDEYATLLPLITAATYLTEKMLATSSDISAQQIPINNKPKCVTCPYCNKKLLDNRGLTMHKRSCAGEKPAQCSICKERFINEGALAFHMRAHNKCQYCNKSYTTKKSLTRHIQTKHLQ